MRKFSPKFQKMARVHNQKLYRLKLFAYPHMAIANAADGKNSAAKMATAE